MRREKSRQLVFALCLSLWLFVPVGMESMAAQPSTMRVTLNLRSVTVKEFFDNVKSQTGMSFMYSVEQVKNMGAISVSCKNRPVTSVLDEVLGAGSYSYSEGSNIITLNRAQQPQNGKRTLSGVVKDEDGMPLPGVAVFMKDNQAVHTVTDIDGNYTLELPKEGGIVTFSYIGMKRLTYVVKAGDRNLTYNAKLESDTKIEEVVVTGIYTRSKESFTGSASTYTKKELQKVGTTNVLQALKTVDPAFAVLDDTEYGSDPNHLPNINIRGKSSMLGTRDELENDPNQPLFVLDGFESTLSAINDLDINRIESITILKDAASTAIYGSKAANGVVVVETVKPKAGKLQVSYNGNFNVTMPDLSSYDLMDAAEKLEFERLAGRYDVNIVETPNRTSKEIELTEMYYDRQRTIAEGVDTDWLAQPVRVGLNQKHSLYVMGGEEHFMFGIGGAYNGVTGAMKGSDREVLSGNIDLIYRIKKFQFSNKFSISSADYSNPVVTFSTWAEANPFYKMRNSDGTIPQWLEYSDEFVQANPLWDSSLNSYNKGESVTWNNSFMAEWSPTAEWKVRGKFGIVYTLDDTSKFTSPESSSQVLSKEALKRGEYKATETRTKTYEGELTATWAKLFNEKHRINLVVGGNVYSSESTYSGFTAEGFPSGDFTLPSFAGGYPDGSTPTYEESISRSLNGFLNMGYSFDDRYLMDISLRENGSSVFGSSNKYSTTWSVGLGWNLHREKFVMEKLPFISYFKLRASIGNPGNQNFDSGRTLLTYALKSGMLNYFGIGALPDQVGNALLKWQITQDKNIGFDLSLFDNRFSLTLDYYHKVTDPLLINITMPLSSGTTEYYTNAGEQTSQGLNFSAVYHILRDYDNRLLCSVRATGRTQSIRIDKIGDSLSTFNNSGRGTHTQRYYDGSDPDDIWVVRSAGIDPATGKELFYTKDGGYTYDYSYDNEVKVGNTRPDIEGVLGTSFTWKGLSLSLNFRYQLGADVLNEAVLNKVENVNLYYNQDRRALYQRWQKAGDLVQFKDIRDSNSSPITSRFVQRENVLSLESAQVEYEFIDGWIRDLGLSSMKAFVSIRDAFRWSTVRTERGTEYPYARTLEAGLSINF